MFGRNIIRKPLKEYNGSFDVVEIFKTFQGEGPYTGHKSIFIRLGGCNLSCSFCDTEFDEFKAITLNDIIKEVKELAQNDEVRLVVITGGEPFIQHISFLCEKLIANRYKVQIETNGTLFRDVPKEVDIVCSPKNTGNGYKAVRSDILARVSCLKFLVSKYRDGYSVIPEVGQLEYNIPVYVQPIDEYDEVKNKQNLQYAIDLCLKYKYTLSVQMHKIMGVA
ncbi:MAG: 7-carboxy-7-deazaguanine synthase QueE [Rickettsiales bacterium]|nr:7-carboxy-7-deazaguanine synthase QueE [Rickettsiales bacterium]